MKKRKITTLLAAIAILNISSPTIKPLADEMSRSAVLSEENFNKATITKFNLLNDSNIDAYNKKFKMDKENIKSITNNGNQYQDSSIDKAIDGNFNTHWETGNPNKSNFTNEVVIELKEKTALNRIVYAARQDSAKGKGFAEEVEIYGSETDSENDFKLVTTGTYTGSTGDIVEIKFNETNFKRIKFRFKKASGDWASAAEFMFYKEDKLGDKVEKLFTNGLMTQVSTKFNTMDKLKVLENEAKGHPLENIFKEDFNLAKKIIRGEDLGTVKTITAEQHGDMVAHANKNLKFGFGNNNQPTGIAAKPGEKITVYVDADPTQPMPRLAFAQQEGSWSSWMTTVELKSGKNVITVPEIKKDNAYKLDVTIGGSIYIVNPYTSEEQPKAPVIRFASGEKYPFFTVDTKVEEFKKYLTEYKKAIDEDIAKNPNVSDRKVLDIVEFVSDHIVWTGTATGAYETYIKNGVNPLDTIKSYNALMEELFKYYGLDRSNEQNDPKYIRENIRIAQPYAYMYAAGNHIGVGRDVLASFLVPLEKKGGSWGIIHEIGHRMDVSARLFGEVTNNMLPMYMSGYYNNIDNRIPYESHIYKNVLSENSNEYVKGGAFESLAVFWQLEMYKPGYWGKLNRLYREREVNLGKENPTNVKMQYLVKFSSEVIGEDLNEYFARHGFEVNAETREETSKYPKPSGKIWYLNNKKFNYKGNGFKADTKLNLSLSNVSNGIKLTFDVSNNVKSDLLGYEIVKDGEVIGFTATNEFIDTNADKSKNYKYEVIPYDINLGTGGSIVLNSRNDLATNVYISVGGVNYNGSQGVEGLRVNFDLEDKKIYLTNRGTGSIHAGFGDNKYFTLRLLDKDKKEKTSISLTGNDRANQSEYNKLNFVEFEIGDFVEVEHQEAFRLDIYGQKQENKKEVYRITEQGLKSVSPIDNSTISLKGSGKGAFELLFKDNVMKLQNRVSGVFAREYTGFNNYYIEVILKANDGRIKAKSSIYGSMFAENIELNKLDGVNYEYGDILTINHMSPQYISLNGTIIGNKPTGSTQKYELTRQGFKVIQ